MTKTLFGWLLGVLTVVLSPAVIAQVVTDEPIIDEPIVIDEPRIDPRALLPIYNSGKTELSFMETVLDRATTTPETVNPIFQDEVISKLNNLEDKINKLLAK